jgi:hypothetical protein
MFELQMYRLALMSELDRRAADETAGRMFARVARAVRRLRPRRERPRAAVLQPDTSLR